MVVGAFFVISGYVAAYTTTELGQCLEGKLHVLGFLLQTMFFFPSKPTQHVVDGQKKRGPISFGPNSFFVTLPLGTGKFPPTKFPEIRLQQILLPNLPGFWPNILY